jgi:hypothetical protein
MHGKEERVNKRNAVYLSGTSDFFSGLWQALLPGNILLELKKNQSKLILFLFWHLEISTIESNIKIKNTILPIAVKTRSPW